MLFEIAFNRANAPHNTKEFFKEIIGATIDKEEYRYYEIELNSFEELEELLLKINTLIFNRSWGYAALINFDPPCIYLDDKA